MHEFNTQNVEVKEENIANVFILLYTRIDSFTQDKTSCGAAFFHKNIFTIWHIIYENNDLIKVGMYTMQCYCAYFKTYMKLSNRGLPFGISMFVKAK